MKNFESMADIALIKLSKPATLNQFVQPIALPTSCLTWYDTVRFFFKSRINPILISQPTTFPLFFVLVWLSLLNLKRVFFSVWRPIGPPSVMKPKKNFRVTPLLYRLINAICKLGPTPIIGLIHFSYSVKYYSSQILHKGLTSDFLYLNHIHWI